MSRPEPRVRLVGFVVGFVVGVGVAVYAGFSGWGVVLIGVGVGLLCWGAAAAWS